MITPVVAAEIQARADAAVDMGGTLLALARPEGLDEVNLARLFIGSGTWCPLGQVFGDYWTGAETLFGPAPAEELHAAAVEYGFHWDRAHTDVAGAEIAALTDAWRAWITAWRRERAA